MVNGGANGGEVGGVRSPAAGEPNGVGGDGHCSATAAGWVWATDARERKREGLTREGRRNKEEKRKERKEKERKEK